MRKRRRVWQEQAEQSKREARAGRASARSQRRFMLATSCPKSDPDGLGWAPQRGHHANRPAVLPRETLAFLGCMPSLSPSVVRALALAYLTLLSFGARYDSK